MKRLATFFLCVFALLAILIAIVAMHDAPRLFKTQYYTKITTSFPADDGSHIWQYVYRLPSYTSDGVARQLDFRAYKVLRRNAFLRVYARNDGTVTAWEEVTPDQVPPSARNQLKIRHI